MANEPTVTAMMITGLPGRVDLAKNAVKSFLSQTWRCKELLIINHSLGMAHEYRIMDTNAFHHRPGESSRVSSVRELMVKRPETLGDLRNMALDAAAGNWIAPWDDDDWSHPERIKAMMNKRIDGHAVTVTTHVRYSIPRNTAYVYHNPEGCANILLYPKENARYASMEKGSDGKLYLDHFAERTVIWKNRQEFPHIFLRFFHGGNIWDDLHIMREYASEKWHNE
ncbi:MAG: glycosyltransferase, partial [Deltaproteobacteria bacterium]|nr:glycosyltransferase [Deltaproteobacteria bacterium]